METLEKLRNGIEQLPKWLLLVLVIFLDGLVGGLYRAAGKTTAAKVIGWIMAAAYVLSILSFVELPAALANVSRIVTVVCMIADIITVITSGKITFFAERRGPCDFIRLPGALGSGKIFPEEMKKKS